MRKVWLVASLVVAVPQIARSQTKTSTDALRQQIKEELREELREELKEEIKAEIKSELSSEGAAAGPVQEDAWAEEEWKWEEPVKPELNFLEFDGYFRFRYDLFNKLDLNTYYKNSEDGVEYGPFAPGFAPPTPACNTDQGRRERDVNGNPSRLAGATSCANNAGPSSTLGSANMRLRLEPVFNVYEDIKVKMQLDILDNLILGSTPDGFPRNPISPLLAFSQTQVPPSDGTNALQDSIRVKRAWAEVMTPLGQLRVGRMPSHFGMGLLANQGSGLDSDFGDTNDRVMFATKIGDFYIVPAYDWALSGPTSAQRDLPYGQPFDRDNRDDVDQYILAVVKRDTDEQMKQKLENDELVFNFGTYHVGRFQALDAASYYTGNDPEAQHQANEFIERDAQAWIYSFWGQLIYRKFSVEAEYSGIVGRINNSAFSGPYGTTDKKLHINQHAGALNLEYKLLRDALTIRLLTVVASGDRAAGWGVRPLLSQTNTPGQWDGTQAPDDQDSDGDGNPDDENGDGFAEGDDEINNYRIDPDFIVDMILWRQLVGVVTDALIIRPGVQYNLTEGFGGSLDLVYSRAWFSESTPSGSFTDLDKDGIPDLGSPNANLGIELDFKVFFDSEDGFHAWLQYGLFIPLSGLDRRVDVEANSPLEHTLITEKATADGPDIGQRDVAKLDASLAHTIQVFLGVSF